MIFPQKYKVLDQNTIEKGNYSIVPVRFKDRIEIMNWRNDQMFHLRQEIKLTRETQDFYFKKTVLELFLSETPSQLLFSYLKEGKLIGYGGLVHINWFDRNAEVSFIMEPSLETNEFETHWSTYLSLLKKIAFTNLNFKSLNTYAYNLRPHLYPVLEKNNFKLKKHLVNEVLVDEKKIDVFIHECINPSLLLEVRVVKENDVDLIFNWSNDPLVRSQSFLSDPINFKEHEKWFKKNEKGRVAKGRKKIFQDMLLDNDGNEKMVFFWNNRNARRKQSGSLIWWYKEFLDKIGHDKAILMMHTEPKDQHGQDLEAIIGELGLTNGEVIFSIAKIGPEELAEVYNAADCTINISDAEGFGLATLESLSCGVPIMVNLTGGLQEQVTDGENWFGIGIEPSSKAIIGSQQVPYICEDRISKENFLKAIEKMYNAWKDDTDEYRNWSEMGMKHVQKNYNFENFEKKWVEIMLNIHEKHGSWETRKGYKSWELREVA